MYSIAIVGTQILNLDLFFKVLLQVGS
eukprot:SAG31_NODE_15548_length_749_cov_1.187692_1_plen_27_part_10